MRNNTLTTISTLMLFVPWTILLLRMNAWALESPSAEIIICSYAAFMIFSGIFTLTSYIKAKTKNGIMKICLMVNGLYGIVGFAIFGMILLSKVI